VKKFDIEDAFKYAVGYAGISPDQFWRMTPHELSLALAGYREKQEETVKLVLYHAWHTAAFERTKRLPSLNRILKPEPRRYTPEEKEEILKELKRLDQEVRRERA